MELLPPKCTEYTRYMMFIYRKRGSFTVRNHNNIIYYYYIYIYFFLYLNKPLLCYKALKEKTDRTTFVPSLWKIKDEDIKKSENVVYI